VLVSRAGGFVVSVRAPLARPRGAGALCEQFEGGGGREGAAGIAFLPQNALSRFVDRFESTYDVE
jgi:hypothetical protein